MLAQTKHGLSTSQRFVALYCCHPCNCTKVLLQAFQSPRRWEKSDAEVDLMQASASATAAAMKECIQLSRPGIQEAQLAAVFGKAQQQSNHALA